MILSIIIPCYNAEPYIHELLDTLAPQITDEVEVILVDDGSEKPIKTKHKYVKVIRKQNGGCATARNRGLDEAAGDYVQFLDADDLVPEYFIKRLLLKIEESAADVIDFSWKSLSKEERKSANLAWSLGLSIFMDSENHAGFFVLHFICGFATLTALLFPILQIANFH